VLNTSLSKRVKVFFYRAMHYACRPSVRPSVCKVDGLWWYRLEFFENNFTVARSPQTPTSRVYFISPRSSTSCPIKTTSSYRQCQSNCVKRVSNGRKSCLFVCRRLQSYFKSLKELSSSAQSARRSPAAGDASSWTDAWTVGDGRAEAEEFNSSTSSSSTVVEGRKY